MKRYTISDINRVLTKYEKPPSQNMATGMFLNRRRKFTFLAHSLRLPPTYVYVAGTLQIAILFYIEKK